MLRIRKLCADTLNFHVRQIATNRRVSRQNELREKTDAAKLSTTNCRVRQLLANCHEWLSRPVEHQIKHSFFKWSKHDRGKRWDGDAGLFGRLGGGGSHFFHHFRHGDVGPAVAFAGAVNDAALEGRVGVGEKFIEEMDGVVEVVIVRLTNGDVEFSLEFGAEG